MYKLPQLPYDYEALEPVISRDIMRLHHQKHHQAYVDKLNAAWQAADKNTTEAYPSLEALMRALPELPPALQTAVRQHGGGHWNHSQFWQWLSPRGGGQPSGALAAQLDRRYGSFQGFVDEFTTNAQQLFGSGWVWLLPDGAITTTPNQENPLMSGGPAPILGLDVWEHAYYLDYRNRRDEYIAAWWRVVNWPEVERRASLGSVAD